MGHRQARPKDPDYDALLERCMDLRVQVSLMSDAEHRDQDQFDRRVRDLAELEKRLAQAW